MAQKKSASKDAEAKKRSDAAKKAAKTRAENAEADEQVPVDPTDDSMAVVGGFVRVVKGEHEGRYGVLIAAPSKHNCIVRTRDAATERLVVDYSELEPAEAGLA